MWNFRGGDTWIQGSDTEEEGVWRYDEGSHDYGGYDDGRLMVYSKLGRHWNEESSRDLAYMKNNKYWYHGTNDWYLFFICEKETGTFYYAILIPQAIKYLPWCKSY